ncbi:hypothetical protein HanHA300_Chr06g0218211 [Helianthus annuus]|nr:hypothetical protein HanHA300_Chr06g0218211 [Helianthus annuus]
MISGEIKEKENVDDLSLFVDFSGVNLNLDVLQNSNQIRVALGIFVLFCCIFLLV